MRIEKSKIHLWSETQLFNELEATQKTFVLKYINIYIKNLF